MDDYFITRIPIAILVASMLARHGILKQSLSISGGLAALLVGFITFTSSYRFGIILIVFYYTGSKLTNLRADIKIKLEEGFQIGGQRNAYQVLANSIVATVVAASYCYFVGTDRPISFASSRDIIYVGSYPFCRNKIGALLWSMYVAHYACAAGDTWASEIGVLSSSPPRLITKFLLVTVPPGTNGGMSFLGTIASAVGGFCIGMVFYLMGYIMHEPMDYASGSEYPMVILGLLCGFMGSIFDSLLGATLQASYYSTERKCIVKQFNANDKSIIHVCGLDILSNESVNALSIVLTMIFAAFISQPLFCYFDSNHCS